jgi:TraM recognition site of TraD and TraG
MWRLHADVMPDEAAAMSVLVLADLHDAAGRAGVPWTLLLDEFGAVIQIAALSATAILQRGRTHGGQVVVATQSVMDAEALTQQAGLVASLTDNLSGVVAHRQIAPESRDWLAKLMGTRALWQSTNQTRQPGAEHSGQGSSRRVREFRIGSDVFTELEQGEAVIYTTHGPEPKRGRIAPSELPPADPERIGAGRHACELLVHAAETLEGRPAVSQGPVVGRIDPDS